MAQIRSLREEVEEFFALAMAQCQPHPELDELRAAVESGWRAVNQPMRVALVGKVNAGKSTMMNAFLGEELAPTGNVELTFNVSWFRYGEERKLLVHTVDGRIEEETFANLDGLTRRCEQNRSLLERIRYIEVRCPNPLLKTFDLIDTPGLHSFYEKDSRNTRELLTDPVSRPHAVVFLYAGSLQEPDVRELERFHQDRGSLMSGLTAIGALTKVDEWENTFEDGRRSIRHLQDHHPQIRRYFYTVMPVVGPAAFGAQTLAPCERSTLESLAKLPAARLQKLLRDAAIFSSKEYPDEPLVPPAADRKRLFARLGRFGIQRATWGLAEGLEFGKLAEALVRESNVGPLREVVTSHFGSRAFLIKTRSALTNIREKAFLDSERTGGRAREAAAAIAGRIDGIDGNEPRFKEFRLLERYYRGALPLGEDEVRELLALTGENGTSCRDRLGAAAGIGMEELLGLAEKRQMYWRARGYEPWAGVDAQNLARILADSYAGIHARLSEADEHLRAAERLMAYEI